MVCTRQNLALRKWRISIKKVCTFDFELEAVLPQLTQETRASPHSKYF